MLGLVAALAGMLVPASAGSAVSALPNPAVTATANSACQPDPTNPAPQVLKCRYGPLAVTPGSNLILLGPITIESPRGDGYITSFKSNMVDAVNGSVPPIHQVHLHHGVWLSVLNDVQTPFYATGEEKTEVEIPGGYGYQIRPTHTWLLNYMIHNLSGSTSSVFITYEMGWINSSSPQAATIKPVKPLWYDVVGGFYPVYNPSNVVDTVTDPEAPSGFSHTRKRTFNAASADTEIVWMAGHVHPGGMRTEVRVERCNGATVAGSPLLYDSEAVFNDWAAQQPPGSSFGSWDYRMTATKDDFRFAVKGGDRLSVTSIYDIGHPWYEAMGIVFAWGRPLAANESPTVPFCQMPDAAHQVGRLTAPLPPNLPVFGGQGGAGAYPDPTTAPVGPVTANVPIAAFSFLGAGIGQPAGVTAGSKVTFTNLDAAASILHAVTSCDAPCNASTGQSYPLPSWTFDSRQLGYGIPYDYGDDHDAPASQQASWDLSIPANAAPNDLITFFCRVHPFMRGALKVV